MMRFNLATVPQRSVRQMCGPTMAGLHLFSLLLLLVGPRSSAAPTIEDGVPVHLELQKGRVLIFRGQVIRSLDMVVRSNKLFMNGVLVMAGYDAVAAEAADTTRFKDVPLYTALIGKGIAPTNAATACRTAESALRDSLCSAARTMKNEDPGRKSETAQRFLRRFSGVCEDIGFGDDPPWYKLYSVRWPIHIVCGPVTMTFTRPDYLLRCAQEIVDYLADNVDGQVALYVGSAGLRLHFSGESAVEAIQQVTTSYAKGVPVSGPIPQRLLADDLRAGH